MLSGFNDLATLRPDLAREWHPDNLKKPSEVTFSSHFKARWVCPEGHEWVAKVNGRASLGSGCPVCSGRVPHATRSLLSESPGVAAEWHPDNSGSPEDFTPASGARAKWICSWGHEWETRIADRTSTGTNCPACASYGPSGMEKEFAAFISGIADDPGVISGDREIIAPKELDVTIPNMRMAFEFNGLYWHSSAHKDRNYHFKKSLDAEAAGFQLIHVWEDDWRDRRAIVETMLKRKLGVSNEPRLNARSLEYRQASVAESSAFLGANHIQGSAGGSWRGGLFKDDELVALMLMKRRSEGHYELTRFATSAIVRGGHSKLLKRAIEDLQPERIVTFADRGVSDGGVYAACGFVRDGEVPPDYSYLVRDSRVHKFNYRKARFKSDPELKYVEGLPERELADLNGLSRVYDAGKVRWVWKPKTPLD